MAGGILAATVGGPIVVVLLFGTYFMISNFVAKLLYLWLNFRGRVPWLYYIIIAPGTIAHETAHFLACIVSGVRVTQFKPFQLPDEDGVLGFVAHEQIDDAYRQSIVSLAPLFFCFVLIIGLIQFLLPGLSFYPFEYDFGRAVWSWNFLLFVYLAISLTAASAPSTADLANVTEVFFRKPWYIAHIVLTIAAFYVSWLWAYFDQDRTELDSAIISLCAAAAFFLVFWLLTAGWGVFFLAMIGGLVLTIALSFLFPHWDLFAVVAGSYAVVSLIANAITPFLCRPSYY